MVHPSPKPLPPRLREILERPNFVHLATIRADGSPKLDPVWVGVRDDTTLLVGTGRSSLKTQNVLRDPRVALSVVDRDNPYLEGQMRGVATVIADPDVAIMDAISHKYIGTPFTMRGSDRVALVITITQARFAELPFRDTPPV